MMKNSCGEVSIINTNLNSFPVVAAAGRISTTFGSAEEILNKSIGNSNNYDLILKVLKSGHKSIIEHMTFNLAFNNVSVFVEQFIIEFRLASYTVQSRRYVDFSNVGYYVPNDLGSDNQLIYKKNMDTLFESYGRLLELGIPKEDARFILPYCFRSNFYCTCNARELIHIICNMLYGRGSYFPELVNLGKMLKRELDKILPNVIEAEREKYEKDKNRFKEIQLTTVPFPMIAKSEVELVSDSNLCVNDISMISSMNFGVGNENTLTEVIHSNRARELELVTQVYKINNISMAALTHLTRHRMQTLLIPNVINSLEANSYVLPESIMNDEKAKIIYENAVRSNYECIKTLLEHNIKKENLAYFVLSGNTLDVITALNAREFWQFCCLRTCSRAQWEIRKIAIKMLNLARNSNFELFGLYGPSCFADGRCPEGRMSCGKADIMRGMFEKRIIDEEKV